MSFACRDLAVKPGTCALTPAILGREEISVLFKQRLQASAGHPLVGRMDVRNNAL
jgi:hypothetical protein